MTERDYRTYKLEERVIEWIDEFADENDSKKSEVVNRAVKVYAAKIASGEINDPRFSDRIDKKFRK